MQKIPTFQNSSAIFTQTTNLGTQLVTIKITWNSRAKYFFMDLETATGKKVSSIKMVQNWLLLKDSAPQLDFIGDLIILKDNINAPKEITYDSLGLDFGFYYLNETEIASWKTLNGL